MRVVLALGIERASTETHSHLILYTHEAQCIWPWLSLTSGRIDRLKSRSWSRQDADLSGGVARSKDHFAGVSLGAHTTLHGLHGRNTCTHFFSGPRWLAEFAEATQRQQKQLSLYTRDSAIIYYSLALSATYFMDELAIGENKTCQNYNQRVF